VAKTGAEAGFHLTETMSPQHAQMSCLAVRIAVQAVCGANIRSMVSSTAISYPVNGTSAKSLTLKNRGRGIIPPPGSSTHFFKLTSDNHDGLPDPWSKAAVGLNREDRIAVANEFYRHSAAEEADGTAPETEFGKGVFEGFQCHDIGGADAGHELDPRERTGALQDFLATHVPIHAENGAQFQLFANGRWFVPRQRRGGIHGGGERSVGHSLTWGGAL
jgi:hypothetical protein